MRVLDKLRKLLADVSPETAADEIVTAVVPYTASTGAWWPRSLHENVPVLRHALHNMHILLILTSSRSVIVLYTLYNVQYLLS